MHGLGADIYHRVVGGVDGDGPDLAFDYSAPMHAPIVRAVHAIPGNGGVDALWLLRATGDGIDHTVWKFMAHLLPAPLAGAPHEQAMLRSCIESKILDHVSSRSEPALWQLLCWPEPRIQHTPELPPALGRAMRLAVPDERRCAHYWPGSPLSPPRPPFRESWATAVPPAAGRSAGR